MSAHVSIRFLRSAVDLRCVSHCHADWSISIEEDTSRKYFLLNDENPVQQKWKVSSGFVVEMNFLLHKQKYRKRKYK